MPLVVEDGTGVAAADSYISLSDARTYATTRGISISQDEETANVQLRNAFDHLETYRDKFKGRRTADDQSCQWPRYGVYVDGVLVEDNEIPDLLRYAQVHIAAAIHSGLDITPNSDGSPFATREKVGPIETEYSFTIATTGIPILRRVETLLAPLLTVSAGLTVERA